MTLLSDRDIRSYIEQGHIRISPYDDKLVQSASVDLRLDEIETHLAFISPGEFCLASTIEVVGVSGHVAAQVAGKSSIASPCDQPYRGKYQDQRGITADRTRQRQWLDDYTDAL